MKMTGVHPLCRRMAPASVAGQGRASPTVPGMGLLWGYMKIVTLQVWVPA